jgi:hypothetical protein
MRFRHWRVSNGRVVIIAATYPDGTPFFKVARLAEPRCAASLLRLPLGRWRSRSRSRPKFR